MARYKNINMQGTTAEQKKLIREALRLEDEKNARKNGWRRIGSGVFKVAYRKKDIVVKFGRKDPINIKSEVRLYNKLKKKHQKFFARIYAHKKNRCVQEAVKVKRLDYAQYDELSKIAYYYNVEDHNESHNVGLRKNNEPVLYDYQTCLHW